MVSNLSRGVFECQEYNGSVLCVRDYFKPILARLNTTLSGTEPPVCVDFQIGLIHRLIWKILGIEGGPAALLIPSGDSHDNVARECSPDRSLILNLTSEEIRSIYASRLPKILALILSEPERVFTYTMIGGSGIFVNLLVANSTFSFIGRALGGFSRNVISSLSGFEASVLWNFALHEKITFRDVPLEKGPRGVLKRLVKYHFASIVSMLAQVSLATLLPALIGVPFLLGQLAGIFAGYVLNLILGYFHTWSRQRV